MSVAVIGVPVARHPFSLLRSNDDLAAPGAA
jgi:hypothetical protein